MEFRSGTSRYLSSNGPEFKLQLVFGKSTRELRTIDQQQRRRVVSANGLKPERNASYPNATSPEHLVSRRQPGAFVQPMQEEQPKPDRELQVQEQEQ